MEIAGRVVGERRIEGHAVPVRRGCGVPAGHVVVQVVAGPGRGIRLLANHGAVPADIAVVIALEPIDPSAGELIDPPVRSRGIQHAVGHGQGSLAEGDGGGASPQHAVFDLEGSLGDERRVSEAPVAVLPEHGPNQAGVVAFGQAQARGAVVLDANGVELAPDGLVEGNADLGVSDRQILHSDVDRILQGKDGRGREGLRREDGGGRRIGAALDGDVQVAPARIRLVDLDGRGSDRVGAHVHVDDVFRIQIVGVENRLQAGHGPVRGQAVVRGASGRRTIDVPVGAGIVHVVGNRSAVAEHEPGQGRGDDVFVVLAADAPPAQRGTAEGNAVPQIAARAGRPAAYDFGPGDPVVAGILDANRVVGRGPADGPFELDVARGRAAVVQGQQRQPAAQRRLAGLLGASVKADVHPLPVGGRLLRPLHRLDRSGIDQGGRRRIGHPPGPRLVASARALQMEIAVFRIGQLRIVRQGKSVLPRGQGPGGNRGVYGRARAGAVAGLVSADRRTGQRRDVQAVVVASRAHRRIVLPRIDSERTRLHHPEDGIGDGDVTPVQVQPVSVRPKHARPHLQGRPRERRGKLDAGVPVALQDRMPEHGVGGLLDENPVLAVLDVQPLAGDEIAFVDEDAVGGVPDAEMGEPDAVGAVQMESVRRRIGQDVDAAPGRLVGAADDVHLLGGRRGHPAGVEFAERRDAGRLVIAGVHVDHVAGFQVVGVHDFGNPALGSGGGKAGMDGVAVGGAIHVAVRVFVVHVIVDRAVVEDERQLAGRHDVGFRLVLDAPPPQRRRRKAGAVPGDPSPGGRKPAGHEVPGVAVVDGHVQAHRVPRRRPGSHPVQVDLAGGHAAAVQGQHVEGRIGLRLRGPFRAAVQAHVHAPAVVGRLVRPRRGIGTPHVDQRG